MLLSRALRAIAVLLLIVACAPAARPTAEPATRRPSAGGLYTLSYTAEIDPIPLNTLHAWTVHVESTTGAPVTGATLAVDGGMPAHDHGMPTRPQQGAELGGGDYRIEGMKFQMAGAWTVTITVTAAAGVDSTTFELLLP